MWDCASLRVRDQHYAFQNLIQRTEQHSIMWHRRTHCTALTKWTQCMECRTPHGEISSLNWRKPSQPLYLFLIHWCKGFSLLCAQNHKVSFNSEENKKVLLMQSATWRHEVKTPWPSGASLQCWGGKRVQSVRKHVVTHSLVKTLRLKQAELCHNRWCDVHQTWS